MSNLILDFDLVIYNKRIDKDIVFFGNSVRIIHSNIIIRKGFTWDGCTWARDGKKRFDGKPITADASCVHDALLDCLDMFPSFPLSKKQIDQIFRDELILCRYKFLGFIPVYITAYSYYFGVHYLNKIPDFFSKGKK